MQSNKRRWKYSEVLNAVEPIELLELTLVISRAIRVQPIQVVVNPFASGV